MLCYKRSKSDRLLTNKSEMLNFYNEWYTAGLPTFQPSPLATPTVSDDEEELDNNSAVGDEVNGLPVKV